MSKKTRTEPHGASEASQNTSEGHSRSLTRLVLTKIVILQLLGDLKPLSPELFHDRSPVHASAVGDAGSRIIAEGRVQERGQSER